MRDNLATVLDAAYWGLAISAVIVAITTAAVTTIAGYWTGRLAIWTGRRLRHRWDLQRMRRRPAPPQSATPAVLALMAGIAAVTYAARTGRRT